MIARKQFWQNWSSEQRTKTILVITPWLGTEEKMRMRREALEENIALQFMRPNSDPYRGLNIVLGLKHVFLQFCLSVIEKVLFF